MKIGDIATYIKRGITPKYVESGGLAVVNQKCIKNGQINNDLYKYTDKDKKYNEDKIVRAGDILINSTGSGTLGRVAYVDEQCNFTYVDSHVTILRCENYNSKFLFYWLRPLEKYIESLGKGSTNQLELSADAISEIEIPDFELDYQDRVISILSCYDAVLVNNQMQIQLLEEAARRIFKEWFLDLRFDNYESVPLIDGTPKGWSRKKLGELIEFNPKMVLNKARTKQCVPMAALNTDLMVLNESEYTETLSNSGAKFKNGDTLLARITPCLENGKTAFVSGIRDEEGAVGSTEFIVMRSKKLNPYIVYLLARTQDFRQTAINSMTGSDGRQRAQVDKLEEYEFYDVPVDVLLAFEKVVKPLFDSVYVKHSQNAALISARDRLLPKLMNGEIDL